MTAMSQINSVRITDPEICGIIAREQTRRGEATAARTVGKIVTEWKAMNRVIDAAPSVPPSGAADQPGSPSIRGNTESSAAKPLPSSDGATSE